MRPTFSQRLVAAGLTSAVFLVVYNGCNFLTSLRGDVGTCAFSWETSIPFVPALIVPYWSIDGMYFLAPFFIPTQFGLRQHVLRVITAVFAAGACFLLFPMTLVFQRPAVEGWLGQMFGSLEVMHNFYNCAPSLHIALLAILWTVYVTPAPPLLRPWAAAWYVLIFLSTMLCWQHQVVDVWTGQLLGLLCLHLFPAHQPAAPRVDAKLRINARLDVAARYLALTLGLAALTWAGWPASMVLIWPTVAVFLVTLAYAGGGPTLLGKTGPTLPRPTRWLMAPVHWVHDRVSRSYAARLPASVEFAPGLFLGRRHTAAEAAAAPFESVLDLMAEFPEQPALARRSYRSLPVLDLCSASSEQLREAVQWVGGERAAGRRVLIHCALGVGRAAQVAIACLMAEGLAFEEAEARVRSVQPRMAMRHRLSLEDLARGF